MIITFASSKGGVGKSTLCLSLAALFADGGDRVLVLDLDQNHTLGRWSADEQIPGIDGLTVVSAPTRSFYDTLKKEITSGRYDHILIDLAGVLEATMMKAIAESDLVIVPAQLSEPDTWEAIQIADGIDAWNERARYRIPYGIVFTKVRTLKTKLDRDIRAQLADSGYPLFKTEIADRIAYKELLMAGTPPHRSRSKEAGEELRRLVREIEKTDAPARAKAKKAG